MNAIEILMNAPQEGLDAYLDEACGGDKALRQRVNELLEAETKAAAFMGQPVLDRQAADTGPADPEGSGSIIGHYKLLQEIGVGGFGTVYMAEQLEPVKRRVALKIIKLGMDTKQVIARFEVERQALAMMDHPNIARVLDAGSTLSGRPYFVMELVRGIPITEFCELEKLGPKQRLELFIKVCGAVQHAHQKGIIHRDLKPSNILVTRHGDQAVPKVIDFGVAKATSQELTDKTLFTRFEQFIGTPAYMSPEQAEMSGLDIDTRSDIYSLGVLLYEMVTGTPPFDPKQLAMVAQNEIRRVICEDEPPKPSTRLSHLSRTAGRQDAGQKAMVKELESDLDWIVMKAIDKNRQRRYETANAMAADIQRHLNDEPVTAAAPSVSYRLGKYVRRNRTGLAIAAGFVAMLLAGAIASSILAFRATRAERSARGAQDDANRAKDVAIGAKDALQRALTKTVEAQRGLAFRLADEHLAAGDPATGIAMLAKLVRDDREDRVAAERLMSELRLRQFAALPVAELPPLDRPDLSEDGSKVVTELVGESGFRVWDVERQVPLGAPMRLGSEFASSPIAAFFSHRGDRILTWFSQAEGEGTKHWAQVWDWASGEKVGRALPHKSQIEFVIFSRDDRRVFTGEDSGVARVWDAESGQPVTPELRVRGGASVVCGDLSDDGHWAIAGAIGGPAKIWDAETGKLQSTLPHHSSLFCIEFSPDSTRALTAGDDGRICLWDVITGRLLSETSHSDRIIGAEFSPDGGRILTASWDGDVRVWEAESGQALIDPIQHDSKLLAAHFSPDGRRIVSSDEGGQIQIWDSLTGDPIGPPIYRPVLSIDVWFSADGKRLIGSYNQSATQILDLQPGQPPCQIFRHREDRAWKYFSGNVFSAGFSPDGERLITTGKDRHVRAWDTKTGAPIFHSRHSWIPTSARYSPDGRVALSVAHGVGSGGGVRIWDAESGELVSTPVSTGIIEWGEFSPVEADGAGFLVVAASNSDNVAYVAEAATGEPACPPLAHAGTVKMASFSADGKLIITASLDGTAKLWDTASGRMLHRMEHGAGVNSARFDRSGRRVVTASKDNGVRVWDVASGKELLDQAMWHSDIVHYAEFSPDGNAIISCSVDDTARLWVAATGEPRGLPLQHKGAVLSARFSPDGTRIVTASVDGSARLWDSQTGLPLSGALRHDAQVMSAEFSPDGLQVVTTGIDTTARLWEMPPAPAGPVPAWVAEWAEAIVGRRISKGSEGGSAAEVPWEERHQICQEVRRKSGDDLYHRTAQWFYTLPSERSISPFSPISLDQFVANRLRENTETSLREALRVDPQNPDLLAALGKRLAAAGGKRLDLDQLKRAEWITREAIAIRGGDPALSTELAQIEKQMDRIEAGRSLDQLAAEAITALQAGDRSQAVPLLVAETLGRILVEAEAAWPALPKAGGGRPHPLSPVTEYAFPTITILPAGADWRHLDVDQDPGSGWCEIDYDDTAWHRGPAPLGFGKDGEVTPIKEPDSDSLPAKTSYFFRHRLTDVDPQQISAGTRRLFLKIKCDDGAVIYVNGMEQHRLNMPAGPINHDTPALKKISGTDEQTWHHLELDPNQLRHGDNVLAVEVHQRHGANKRSSDLSLDLELFARLEPTDYMDAQRGEIWAEAVGRLTTALPDGRSKETRRRWQLALAAGIPQDAGRDDLPYRAKVQAALGHWDTALECLDALIAQDQDSFEPADIRRRAGWLQRKLQILAAAGRDAEAATVRELITAIPPRDPALDTGKIDLSSYGLKSFFAASPPAWDSAGFWQERVAETFNPDGEPDFDIRGRIQLNSGTFGDDPAYGDIAGTDLNRLSKTSHPMAVEGIRIGRKCQAIHFLHACSHGREKTGVEVATYLIHFDDGATKTVPVIYGEDMIDFWPHTQQDDALAGVGQFAWRHRFSQNDQPDGMLGLTRQTWQNDDHPDTTITHIDFVSTAKLAAPFLVAITVE